MTEETSIIAERPNMTGQWELSKQENFEEFLAAYGLNWLVRKMAANARAYVNLFHNGDHFMIQTGAGPMVREEQFSVGEEYEQLQPGPGASIEKGVAHWEGDKLVIKYRDPKGIKPNRTLIREITSAGELLFTFLVDNSDVVAKRWFIKRN